MAIRHRALELISEAYMLLLQLPADNPLRYKNQYTYAGLRDYIARKTGQDSEQVQNTYEEHARMLREHL